MSTSTVSPTMVPRRIRVAPDFPLKGCGIRGAKFARHQRKGSATSGRIKVKSCQAKWLHRYACQRNRSYTDKMYPTIMNSIDKKSGELGRWHGEDTQGLGRRAQLLPAIMAGHRIAGRG